MTDARLIDCLKALAQQTRLDVVRLLAVSPDGLQASIIAERLDIARNAMSTHLKILHNAGLVEATSAGRTVTYRIVDEALTTLETSLSGLRGA